MRIAIDGHFLEKGASGNSRYVLGLLEGISQIDEADELLVYVARDRGHVAGAPPDDQLTQLRRLRDRFGGSRIRSSQLASRNPISRLAWELPRKLASDAVDVAQFQYIGPLNSPCPVAVAVHDVSFCLAPGMLGWRTNLRMRLTTRSALRRASVVLTPSKWSAEMVARFYPDSKDKVYSVPLGASELFAERVDSGPDAAGDRQVLVRCSVPEDYFLYVGRRQKRKNIEGLLDSYAGALRLDPDLPPLVMAGPRGEDTGEVLRRIAAEPLRERVVLLHDVPDADLAAVYRGALGFLFPCRYEGFGLPVLEAMACGCPVIVADEGGLPELVQSAGIKIDPTDTEAWAQAIVSVGGDSEGRRRMAEAGLELARPYTWRATAEATRRAYAAALAS